MVTAIDTITEDQLFFISEYYYFIHKKTVTKSMSRYRFHERTTLFQLHALDVGVLRNVGLPRRVRAERFLVGQQSSARWNTTVAAQRPSIGVHGIWKRGERCTLWKSDVSGVTLSFESSKERNLFAWRRPLLSAARVSSTCPSTCATRCHRSRSNEEQSN